MSYTKNMSALQLEKATRRLMLNVLRCAILDAQRKKPKKPKGAKSDVYLNDWKQKRHSAIEFLHSEACDDICRAFGQNRQVLIDNIEKIKFEKDL